MAGHFLRRSSKRLSDDKKIDSALAALEGVCATRMLLLAATKPTAASSNPAMDLVVNCVSFAVEKSAACKFAVTEDELSSRQGVEIFRDK